MFEISEISIQTPTEEINHNDIKKRSLSEIVKGGLHTLRNIPEKISRTCTSIYDAPSVKACRMLGMPNINITQFGPQCHVNGYDLKFTPTAVCTDNSFFCFIGHGELGYLVYSSPIFNVYLLSVNQYGFKVEHNKNINPRDCKCYAAAETLEHKEISLPFLKVGEHSILTGNYSGSLQFIFSIECGKTTTIPISEALKRLKEIFCTLPFALPELLYKVGQDCWQKRNKNSSEVIIEQPRSARVSDNETVHNITDTNQKTDSKKVVYWFGPLFGPADFNSGLTWEISGGNKPGNISVSVQVNNYCRKTYMSTWEDGKFIPPANIEELINAVAEIWCSQGFSDESIEEVIAQAGSVLNILPDEKMREQAVIEIHELGKSIKNSIGTEQEQKREPLPDLLAQTTQVNNRLTVSAEISPEQQHEENTDEVMPSDFRPQTRSQLRKRTLSVLDVSEVKENMRVPPEEDYRQRSSSLSVKASLPVRKSSNIQDNKEPAADETYRPRSSTLEGKKHRLPSEHSD